MPYPAQTLDGRTVIIVSKTSGEAGERDVVLTDEDGRQYFVGIHGRKLEEILPEPTEAEVEVAATAIAEEERETAFDLLDAALAEMPVVDEPAVNIVELDYPKQFGIDEPDKAA
jgi:hypothetical protein